MDPWEEIDCYNNSIKEVSPSSYTTDILLSFMNMPLSCSLTEIIASMQTHYYYS